MNETLDRLEREKLKIASFGKRFLAYVLDNFAVSIIIFVIYFDAFMSAGEDYELIVATISKFSLSLLALNFFYQFIFTALYGATLGKMAFKIAIVDEASLSKPSVMAAFMRTCVRMLSESAFYLGFAWALGNDLRKSWQDYLAKTLVIELA